MKKKAKTLEEKVDKKVARAFHYYLPTKTKNKKLYENIDKLFQETVEFILEEKKKAYNRGYKAGRKYTGIHFYQTSTPKNKLIICKNT